MTPQLQTANTLLAAGVACVPCDTSKKSLVRWREYQHRMPTQQELDEWFSGGSHNIALIAGDVLTIDFDEKHRRGIFANYIQRATEVGLIDLVERCIRQSTPTGGYHLVFRCTFGMCLRNEQLANASSRETMIETRGHGGYFLIAPSAGYTLLRGDFGDIPEITEEEREALLALARTFDEAPPRETREIVLESRAQQHTTSEGLTPGDDYDQRADIPALLREHGWAHAGGKYWTRPGKAHGISASWDVIPRRLWVFSSSTQFEQQHVYRPWHIYSILCHGGDFKAAAAELRRHGYGGASRKPAAPKPTLPQPVTAPVRPVETPEQTECPPIEGGEDPPETEGSQPTPEQAAAEAALAKVRATLSACEYDDSKTPPPLRPVFSLRCGADTVPISTPGNITVLIAQAKAGKTAFLTAMIAATMDSGSNADYLGVVAASNADGGAVIYLDTEQSRDDFWHSTKRAMRRAGAQQRPDWLRSYCLTGLAVNEAVACAWQAVSDAYVRHGRIHAVFLDGAADLVLDVNSAEECNGFVANLHALAIGYDCPVVTVLHLNPKSGNGGYEKARGHLGSQLERKAETNLRIEKDGNVSVCWSEKQRRAPVLKEAGPRFTWSDEAGMHVSAAAGVGEKRPAWVDDYEVIAAELFGGGQRMKYAEIVKAIAEARDIGEGAAKARTKRLIKSGLIETTGMGYYSLKSRGPA